jgi:hypothetical protein
MKGNAIFYHDWDPGPERKDSGRGNRLWWVCGLAGGVESMVISLLDSCITVTVGQCPCL